MTTKILLSGDGGQGIQLIADMICRSAFETGAHVTSIPNYGLEQRGGVSLNFIQISDKKIVYPKFTKPDIVLIMSPQADERVESFKHSTCTILHIKDFEESLKEKKVSRQSYNIFFLGLIANILEEKQILKRDNIFALLKNKLETKPGWDENEKAFKSMYSL